MERHGNRRARGVRTSPRPCPGPEPARGEVAVAVADGHALLLKGEERDGARVARYDSALEAVVEDGRPGKAFVLSDLKDAFKRFSPTT